MNKLVNTLLVTYLLIVLGSIISFIYGISKGEKSFIDNGALLFVGGLFGLYGTCSIAEKML